jgi:hypothetical protein
MGRGRCLFNIGEKLVIVREAYEHPNRLYATAKNYGVDLRSIKRWRELLDVEEIPHTPKIHRLVSSIRVQHEDVYQHLLHYFEVERDRAIPVSVDMLVVEARR